MLVSNVFLVQASAKLFLAVFIYSLTQQRNFVLYSNRLIGIHSFRLEWSINTKYALAVIIKKADDFNIFYSRVTSRILFCVDF